MNSHEARKPRCADCGGPIGEDRGPPDGWQLDDGRTVCHACCAEDARRIAEDLAEAAQRLRLAH